MSVAFQPTHIPEADVQQDRLYVLPDPPALGDAADTILQANIDVRREGAEIARKCLERMRRLMEYVDPQDRDHYTNDIAKLERIVADAPISE